MIIPCPSCHANHWIDERSTHSPSTTAAPRFESCCKKGEVVLNNLQPPPEALERLVSEEMVEAKHFRKHIREYNSSLSFTSLKYSPDKRTSLLGPGIQCFQIHGALYHMQGPIEPQPDQFPQFAQLFLYDPQYATNVRHTIHGELSESILQRLTFMLHATNPFIALYKKAKEQLAEQDNQNQDVRVI